MQYALWNILLNAIALLSFNEVVLQHHNQCVHILYWKILCKLSHFAGRWKPIPGIAAK